MSLFHPVASAFSSGLKELEAKVFSPKLSAFMTLARPQAAQLYTQVHAFIGSIDWGKVFSDFISTYSKDPGSKGVATASVAAATPILVGLTPLLLTSAKELEADVETVIK